MISAFFIEKFHLVSSCRISARFTYRKRTRATLVLESPQATEADAEIFSVDIVP